mgnify:CR=1 FL=1
MMKSIIRSPNDEIDNYQSLAPKAYGLSLPYAIIKGNDKRHFLVKKIEINI